MMCDVMPTISEDGSNDRDSQYSGDDANFEQLMVNMLDERDKLMETLRETQETLSAREAKLQEIERERDALQKQLQSSTPQVGPSFIHRATVSVAVTVASLFTVRHAKRKLICATSLLLHIQSLCFQFWVQQGQAFFPVNCRSSSAVLELGIRL